MSDEIHNRYERLEGGKYLKIVFGFHFTQDPRPAVQVAQDTLFAEASDVARMRSGLRKIIKNQVEEYGFIKQSLERGQDIYYPLGDHFTADPAAVAREIERREQSLKRWVDLVKMLQEQEG